MPEKEYSAYIGKQVVIDASDDGVDYRIAGTLESEGETLLNLVNAVKGYAACYG